MSGNTIEIESVVTELMQLAKRWSEVTSNKVEGREKLKEVLSAAILVELKNINKNLYGIYYQLEKRSKA